MWSKISNLEVSVLLIRLSELLQDHEKNLFKMFISLKPVSVNMAIINNVSFCARHKKVFTKQYWYFGCKSHTSDPYSCIVHIKPVKSIET